MFYELSFAVAGTWIKRNENGKVELLTDLRAVLAKTEDEAIGKYVQESGKDNKGYFLSTTPIAIVFTWR